MSKQPYREDLLLAAYAVALGFEILGGGHAQPLRIGHFNEVSGIPDHGLAFKIMSPDGIEVTVWDTARGWRVARLIDGKYEKPEDHMFHRKLKDALDAAKAL